MNQPNNSLGQPDSSQTCFWTNRWEAGKTPWDLGGIPPALASFLLRGGPPVRVLIPGCGSGYEVKAFHEVGHEVMAIEFSAPAIARAHEVLGRSAIRLFTPTSSSTTLETLALD